MKTMTIIILTAFCACWSQNLKLSGSANFAVGGNELGYQFGPALKIQYEFHNLPLAVQGNVNFNLGDLSTSNINVAAYTNAAVGTTVIFYPFRFFIQPYAGASVFYNINSMSQEGNQNILILDKVDNNFSTEFLIGLNLSPEDLINFITEFAYSYNKPEYTAHYRGQERITTSGKFNLNSFYWKVGLMMNLN